MGADFLGGIRFFAMLSYSMFGAGGKRGQGAGPDCGESLALEEQGHDVAGEPGRRVEARGGAEGGEAVRTADVPGSGDAAAKAVADYRLHVIGLRGGIAQLVSSLAGAAVADGHRPAIEQIAADSHRTMAMVVHLGVVASKATVNKLSTYAL
jgi:hypothetical protein